MRTVWPLASLGFLLSLTTLLGDAFGHDKWLEVTPFFSAAPTVTKVYLVTGEALRQAESLPLRQRSRVSRFQLVTATSGRRELLAELKEDQQPIAVLRPEVLPLGTSIVVLETEPLDIELRPDKFQSYLFGERLFDILVERTRLGEEDAVGRERYSRSLKALVQVGLKLDNRVLRPVGQALELVPLAHPYGLLPGSQLPVQVLFRGQPLAGRAVTFANRQHSDVVTKVVRTDAQGRAQVAVERVGDWLICLVHMERSSEPGAQWRSYWSSLSFALTPSPSG